MQLLMCLLVLKCHCGCTSAIQLELVLLSHVMHKEFRALQASWVHNILVFSDYFWWDMISGINSWGCQHWLCHMSHWLYTGYERSYVRDVGWGSPAGTLVGPDDKPVLKNVDLRWRRNSKHLCSFMLQDTHSQALSWEQLSWTQGKAMSPVSSLITLIVSRKNLENLLRIVHLAFLYIACFYYYTVYSPTSQCNIF